MAVLLKDAINPNIVQTLENNPAIIHGGPFANIAHGCNSVRATKLALKLGDYVVTEAGFGADLGAEKFLDIKCRKTGLKPDCVVCVATLKALKYHGGAPKNSVYEENLEALEKGTQNLLRHIDNLKNKFNCNVVVAINRYVQDLDSEIEFLKEKLATVGVELSLANVWAEGGKGAVDLAEKVVKLSQNDKELNYMYDLKDTLKEKLEKVAKKVYGARGVIYSEEAEAQIKEIEKFEFTKEYPVCIAKTQYSFSDSAKNLLCEEEFDIHINEIILKNGAEFIVAKAGKIMTMPGLPKKPAAENIDIDENGIVSGIF
jgi:formate--tetrahydrofolate ligase